jgi:YesN/AraC family two-component response regulator
MNLKDYKSAYEYMKIARIMQSRFYRERINSQINEMSAKYESEKKEKENFKLRLENEIKELKLNTKTKTINILFAGIIGIGGLLLILFLQYYQKKKAYNSLVKRNLEIVNAEKEYGNITKTDGMSPIGRISVLQSDNLTKESKELIDRLNAYMINEKPYLFSDIKLEDVSLKLDTNRTYLSKLVNEHYNKNFNDFINEFRIKTARQLLVDPDKKHISIEGIGQMAGFNARSTFFTCFKKFTGISPSYFRQSIK